MSETCGTSVSSRTSCCFGAPTSVNKDKKFGELKHMFGINGLKNFKIILFVCSSFLAISSCSAQDFYEKQDENFKIGEMLFADDAYVRTRRQTEVGVREETEDCPDQCKCYTSSREVHCTFTSLPRIPENFPENIEKINIAYNTFSTVRNSAFDATGSTLRYLFLQSNKISSLSSNPFPKLAHVTVLRLSWNHLSAIKKTNLHGLHSVERLYLDNNKITFIHPLALRGLVNLKLLQLDGNQLSILHRESFITMEFMNVFK